MPNAERDLNSFLRRECFRERKEPLTHFVLRHAAPGSKGSEVDSFEIPDGLNSDSLDSFVDEILARAHSDANGMGPGIHRYVLLAKNGEKDCSRCAFRVSGDDEDGEGAGDEAPTMKGLLQQLMRHNENQARTMTNGVGALVSMLSRNLESSHKQIEKLVEQRAKDTEILESARSQEHQRELELLTTSNSEERKQKLFEQFSALVPVFVNKVAGQSVLTNPQKSALKGFIDTLTPEQLDKIRGSLEPAQQIILLQAIKAIQDDEKKLLTSGTNGVS